MSVISFTNNQKQKTTKKRDKTKNSWQPTRLHQKKKTLGSDMLSGPKFNYSKFYRFRILSHILNVIVYLMSNNSVSRVISSLLLFIFFLMDSSVPVFIHSYFSQSYIDFIYSLKYFSLSLCNCGSMIPCLIVHIFIVIVRIRFNDSLSCLCYCADKLQ